MIMKALLYIYICISTVVYLVETHICYHDWDNYLTHNNTPVNYYKNNKLTGPIESIGLYLLLLIVCPAVLFDTIVDTMWWLAHVRENRLSVWLDSKTLTLDKLFNVARHQEFIQREENYRKSKERLNRKMHKQLVDILSDENHPCHDCKFLPSCQGKQSTTCEIYTENLLAYIKNNISETNEL